MAAALWPDFLDESARGSLRTALSLLRQTLSPAADLVWADQREIALAERAVKS